MQRLQPAIENLHEIRPRYYASWLMTRGVPRAKDMRDFGPACQASDSRSVSMIRSGTLKRVTYLPVPKRKGKEEFPSLHVWVQLFDRQDVRGVKVPAWVGAEVAVDVVNLWNPDAPRKVELKARLHDVDKGLRGLECDLEISPETVKSWLDPRGSPLGARVNENLLEFRFRIPVIDEGGEQLTGQSENRIFLYRRKALVFLPGVFGSSVKVTRPDGQVLGFPDLYDDDRMSWMPDVKVQSLAKLTFPLENVGVLECDSSGKPLLEPKKPTLLSASVPLLGHQAYDVFQDLHAAIRRRFAPLPEDFRLFTLFASPYDWRLDLTQTALAKVEELKKVLESEYVSPADSDDQVALIGHSTGGLIARRILVEPQAKDLVSQAFFQNVPFRGAPKTFSVIATGCDPLGLDPNLPFVNPRSMRAMALTSPIVYHLSPSPFYPKKEGIFTVEAPGASGDPLTGLDAERAWVELAIKAGFMPSRKVIPASAPLTREDRARIAFRADEWNEYWEEFTKRRRGREVLRWYLPKVHAEEPDSECVRRGLADQFTLRVEQGWNQQLAEAAAAFHKDCEDWAADGKFADRCFLFYSCAKEGTSLQTSARLVSSREYSLEEFRVQVLQAGVFRPQDLFHPKHREVEVDRRPNTDRKLLEKAAWEVDHWSRPAEDRVVVERWRFATIRQAAGDETVPLVSQIGFGGPANVFKRIGHDTSHGIGPNHLDATKDPWVWDRVLDVLQGADAQGGEITKYLAYDGAARRSLCDQVDPRNGVDKDPHLDWIRDNYVAS